MPPARPSLNHVKEYDGTREQASTEIPLVVDLDGTLVRTDITFEAIFTLLKKKPLTTLPLFLLWSLKGKAFVKHQLAKNVDLDATLLPYHDELCSLLRNEHSRGVRLVLASANNIHFAEQVASHLGFFDQVFGSDASINLKGKHKRDRLVREFGDKGYDYAGNSRSDLIVWSSARYGIVVSSNRRLRKQAAKHTSVRHELSHRHSVFLSYLRTLRSHHWLKNLLVFVPLLASHRIYQIDLIIASAFAFSSFCFLASGLYIFNDLLDLNADRHHPRKMRRPIAAGEVSLANVIVLMVVLFIGAYLLGRQLPANFMMFLAVYFGTTLLYSLHFKKIVILDVIVLAGLYGLRILAGAAAVGVTTSRWLLGFSMFAFLSLALLKRYTEVVTMSAVAGRATTVRGYYSRDSNLLMAMGSASGYISVVILALYADTATADRLYSKNELLWLTCPIILYWISYLWLMAHRNRMPYDPVVFAVRNRTSQVLILMTTALFLLAV